ncbi:NAD(P)/FAD-dependent oxidoreductase [Nonomuraea soli]|uniref:2-polyprenyl-6-methoxyphenol hydroxylase-like FAD-dependent oxidoreductase n=1 Tax=Nonomuraea soli TaxID=1032476 RepID=A0A7W0CTN9_9ACTN|nr:FAD-dependent monooxygenase [Nonomuraea soli]MBA2897075.1 2-polyprenyl-6-methoxyphenol hydroxylase-like FAD-dependent oxidoreductase [Nonomuraea soli]
MTFDAIIVGARVAGAATALLLARQGLRVLLLERSAIGSDTLSSHQLQPAGAAVLERWGLLGELVAAGTPATTHLRLHHGRHVVDAELPRAMFSPRRTLLDAMLVRAAAEAGAEVREHVTVEELVWSEGRVRGVAGRARRGGGFSADAPLVVGADGKHSIVARAVRAGVYRERPSRAFAAYTYVGGLPVGAGEMYQRDGAAAAVFPTNDGLTMVYVSAPLDGFVAYRADPDGTFLGLLDGFGELGERVRSARRAERLRATPDQPNRFRVPYGPGWALVGDAGVVMDSITAQGMTNALRNAELLSLAVASGDFAAHHRERDRGLSRMYDLTLHLARHRPGVAERLFFPLLARRFWRSDRRVGGRRRHRGALAA